MTAYALLDSRFGLAARRFTIDRVHGHPRDRGSVRMFATAIPVALIIGPVVPRQT